MRCGYWLAIAMAARAASAQVPHASVADPVSGCRLDAIATDALDTQVHWTGACKNGLADGAGTARWTAGTSELLRIGGKFAGGRALGTVDVTYANGDHYHGSLVDGRPEGRGVFVSASFAAGTGVRYEGSYKAGLYDGHGVLEQVGDGDRTRYDGEFKAGKRSGYGVEDSSGYHYQGQFDDDEMSGNGTKTWPNGMRYSGDFSAGEARGHGVWTWSNGSSYTGEVSEYAAEGHGVYVDAGGKRHEGQWHLDCLREGAAFINVQGDASLCREATK